MKSWWKILRIVILGLFASVLAALAVLYLRRDEITKLVIEEASRNLKAPVTVQSAELSLQKFPSAAVQLKEVFSKGLAPSPTDTLLYAQSIYLQFGLWEVFGQQIKVDEVSIENGVLHLYRSSQAAANYLIFAETEQDDKQGAFSLERISLKNLRTRYYDGTQALQFKAQIKESAFALRQKKNSSRYWGQANLATSFIEYNDETYCKAQLAASFKFDYTAESAIQSLQLKDLRVGEIPAFDLQWQATGQQQKLSFGIDQLPLAWAQRELARQGIAEWPYQLAGEVSTKLTWANSESDRLKVEFESSNFDLNYDQSVWASLAIKGRYQILEGQDQLEIFELSSAERRGLNLAGKIRDLENPQIQLELRGKTELAYWQDLLPTDSVELSGWAEIDLNLRGDFKDLSAIQPREIAQAEKSGLMNLSNINFQWKGSNQRHRVDGSFQIANADLRIENLHLKSEHSELSLEGLFQNVLNYLFFEDQELNVKAIVKAEKLHLEDYLRTSSQTSENYDLGFAKKLDLELALQLDQFQFQSFNSSGINGNLLVQNNRITGERIKIAADKGFYFGDFILDLNDPQSYLLSANLQTKDLEIQSVFESFQNFGQATITAENLSGRASTNTNLKLRLSPQLSVDPASINLISDLTIVDGHLTHYEPLKALSRFADIQELEDVSFEKLSNTVSIENEMITIPKMNIISSVLQLQLQGQHSFTNQIEYLIKLQLSDVLFAKRKARKAEESTEFEEHLAVADRGDEHIIPISIKGSVEEPIIQIDKQSLGSAIGEELKKQGEEIKAIFKKDEKIKDNESGLIFEWDDGL